MLTHSLSWYYSLTDEDIHQALQRLHVLLGEQIVVHCDSDEVHETAVQLEVSIDVPEGMVPMAVVQVSIAAEHLLDDGFDILVVIRREARSLADPVVVRACERAHRLIDVGRTSTDRSLTARYVAGVVGARVCCGGDGGGRVCGEDMGVVDLADDPALDADYV